MLELCDKALRQAKLTDAAPEAKSTAKFFREFAVVFPCLPPGRILAREPYLALMGAPHVKLSHVIPGHKPVEIQRRRLR